MKSTVIPSSWLRKPGCRFDPRPFASGIFERQDRVESLPHSSLSDLTTGYKGGIFTHNFSPKRTYVEDPAYGVPFLGASAILLADLSGLRLLSNKDAQSRSYRDLTIREGMSLVSCSGSVGRIAYARPEMDGMSSAGDVLKIQPDPGLIPPGYLFAYLASPTGLALLGGGTYGTIVQHLEAQHVSSIPIPRFTPTFEREIHSLIERASTNRTQAVALLRKAGEQMASLFPPNDEHTAANATAVRSDEIQPRMDAYYYSPRCAAARARMDAVRAPRLLLGEVANVEIPGIFKRRYADGPAYGDPYITGGDVFQIAPSSDRYLKSDVAERYGLVVRRGTILVQEAGQLGGLIGRSVLAGSRLDGFAVSNNMFRITTPMPTDAGFLWVLLSSPEGVTLLARESAGSSIPHTDLSRVRHIRIPWPDAHVRKPISDLAWKVTDLRDEACQLEDEACGLVENAIEDAT